MTEQKPIFGHAGGDLVRPAGGLSPVSRSQSHRDVLGDRESGVQIPKFVRAGCPQAHFPNPSTRIALFKIMESSWFRKGLDSKSICIIREMKEPPPLDTDAIFGPDVSSSGDIVQKQESSKMSNLNAFNIISYSPGFDLSGLFDGMDQRKEAWFMTRRLASTIISKLEEIARRLRLKVKKKDGGIMKLEG